MLTTDEFLTIFEHTELARSVITTLAPEQAHVQAAIAQLQKDVNMLTVLLLRSEIERLSAERDKAILMQQLHRE